MTTPQTNNVLTTLLHERAPALPDPADVMTALIELPPGDPGTPPHRHSGPVFGYVTEGALVYELEGAPARVVTAGEAFWEPGGEPVHYRAANHLTDGWTRFVVVMISAARSADAHPAGRVMRILVAGATGVIGRRLVPLLLAAGHEVVAVTRREDAALRLQALGAEGVVADALDRDALLAAVREARPEVVMHQLTDLRGGSSADNAAVRIHGTRNLVDAALAAGVRRIVAQGIAWAYAPGADGERAGPLDLGAAAPRQTTIRGVAALEAAARELPSGSCSATACSTGRTPGTRRTGCVPSTPARARSPPTRTSPASCTSTTRRRRRSRR